MPLAFAAPAVLAALVLLPAIWWLLRLTPPRPRLERFPPARILAELAKREEEPARSPWWLTALRLLLAAFIILALAGPVWRPSDETAPGEGPLLIVIDNGWSSAAGWAGRIETARRIVALAEAAGRPIALAASADGADQELAPGDAAAARARLDALAPRPYASDRAALEAPLAAAAGRTPFGGVAWLAEGIGGADAERFAAFLGSRIAAPATVYSDPGERLGGLLPPDSSADALAVPLLRNQTAAADAGVVRALDLQGRIVGEAGFSFPAGAATATARFTLPVELRNEIVRLDMAGEATAGAVQLVDERFRRRRIGLISGASSDTAQPLLSPLYYIERAVAPFADPIAPREANAAVAIPELIDAGVSVIAMADIGTLPPETEARVAAFVRAGGTLLRFAGPRLAGATGEPDALVPVRLRAGGRVLGGSLSWQTPQKLAAFSAAGPFAGLAVPDDVEVTRQVLAEPDGTLPDRTWATLADGTPLVTAGRLGSGSIVLFHVTADTTWSNLPLSGTFVEMLRRIIAFSAARPSGDAPGEAAGALLPPFRLLDGFGRFATSDPNARPLAGGAGPIAPGRQTPPGLYGAEDGFRAVNLLDRDAAFPPFDARALAGATVAAYPTTKPRDLAPPLLLLAFVLLAADALAVMALQGGLRLRRRAAAAALLGGALLLAAAPPPALAQTADPAGDAFFVEAANATHLAYVMTGDPAVDEISRQGLAGLSRVLSERTTLEPGEPIGVDLARDELAFFPLLYWPVDAAAPMPDSAALARLGAYMKEGGSVLFDTRDQIDRAGTAFAGTPAAERLRAMLRDLDIPPLEPVPGNHVLTKAFYLLGDFPGRYEGGPLWVEASAGDETDPATADRPARPGDGVSSVLITENDFAAAWAMDDSGQWLYPTVPPDPRQREMALRTGVNIVMYTLTGNYKADQVHVPALLERLGQ
nr:DUF4159 domain-containing protein [Prosthecomicrobium pneumaticum]